MRLKPNPSTPLRWDKSAQAREGCKNKSYQGLSSPEGHRRQPGVAPRRLGGAPRRGPDEAWEGPREGGPTTH